MQREALALEATMKSAWASIEADSALTHSVSRRHQKQQRHVNEMTELSTRMRADWLRIANALECEFRGNPAGDSDLMSATVPI